MFSFCTADSQVFARWSLMCFCYIFQSQHIYMGLHFRSSSDIFHLIRPLMAKATSSWAVVQGKALRQPFHNLRSVGYHVSPSISDVSICMLPVLCSCYVTACRVLHVRTSTRVNDICMICGCTFRDKTKIFVCTKCRPVQKQVIA